MANKMKQILELFFSQPIFANLPPVFIMSYFQNIIDNDQLVTTEENGRVVAFADFWVINERIREGLSKLNLPGMMMLLDKGSYPHVEGGKCLYIPFVVSNGDKKSLLELLKKALEKTPTITSICGHRFFKDGKFRIHERHLKLLPKGG